MMSLEADTELFWEQLFERIREERVVPIIGQDLLTVSWQGAEVPLYTLLAERLAAKLGVSAEGLAGPGMLHDVTCRHLTQGGRLDHVYSGLKAVMPSPEELTVPILLKQLAAIEPFKLFVSTTFDSLLRRALDEVRCGGRSETRVINYFPKARESGEIEPSSRPTLVYLFGALSSFPEYAVTDEDLLEFVHSLLGESRRPAFLRDLARTQLLVLGCSFPDWLVRFFLRAGLEERLSKPQGKTDIVADRAIRSDQRLLTFIDHFSPATLVFRQGDAPEFVAELYRRWTAEHPEAAMAGSPVAQTSPEPSPPAGRPGAIFLSYANEDTAAAAAIRDSLQAAGMAVWFDKQALEAGDDFERKIRRAIQSCCLFVAVISRHTVTPEPRFFRLEWSHAIRAVEQMPPNRRFLIPVAVDDVDPTDEALPAELAHLHWQRLPGGRCEAPFIASIREEYRRFQKTQRLAS